MYLHLSKQRGLYKNPYPLYIILSQKKSPVGKDKPKLDIFSKLVYADGKRPILEGRKDFIPKTAKFQSLVRSMKCKNLKK